MPTGRLLLQFEIGSLTDADIYRYQHETAPDYSSPRLIGDTEYPMCCVCPSTYKASAGNSSLLSADKVME